MKSALGPLALAGTASLAGALVACQAAPSAPPAPLPTSPAVGAGGDSPPDAGADAAEAGLEWPNATSQSTSDPWLAEHHDALTKMRPKVLAINFDNDPATRKNFKAHVEALTRGFAEGSRYHGYVDPKAPAFLEYEVAHWVDLADASPPAGWTHKYSTKVPVDCSSTAFYNFDYAALFDERFAAHYDIADPDDPSRKLPLCELYARGMVHEVWIHMNGDPDPYTCADGKKVDTVALAEILENKPTYDAKNVRKPNMFSACAGNGCLEGRALEAFRACNRTVRVLYINSTRGPGCAIHSAGHGYEWMANSRAVPELLPRFAPFANFDLDKRLGLPFGDWYACDAPDCITFKGPNALDWKAKSQHGSVAAYDQACGNVHFAPNSRAHYDENDTQVLSRCEHYGLKDGPGGADAQEPFSKAKYDRYQKLAPDCGGAWQIYWRQSFPGLGNPATDASGKPMRNWWPYLFY
jgi:hypothetical protein